jgi:hypothetical protein
MVSTPRSSSFGFPVPLPRSAYTQVRFVPNLGYTDSPDLLNPPGSITSGRNIWIWQNRLVPRPRLQQLGTNNVLGDQPTGAFAYYDVSGTNYPMIASKATVAYLNSNTWTPLTYVSGVSNKPPSGGVNDLWFGTSTYLPRADANIEVMTNGVDPVFAWAGPSNGTGFSTLTEGPIAKDVSLLQDHVVAWNVRYLSSASQLVTRLQWSARGDPENWSSIASFAGYEDLLDMRGIGTRIFAQNDQLLVATDKELWRGQYVGAPFVFQFTPFARSLGMPFPNAAIQTPDGLYFLGGDLMVYRIDPYWSAQPVAIGKAIQRSLHQMDADPNTSFFGYHADARQLTLYFTTTAGAEPMNGFTLEVDTGTWTPQLFQHALVASFVAPQTSSSATQWNQLVGSFAAQTLTYAQMLGGGASGSEIESLVASAGTAYSLSHSATSDDGVAVTSEAWLGTLFAALPERRKFLDHTRWDLQADSASSVSVSAAPLGGTFQEVALAVSAGSSTSQYRANWGIDSVYHTVRIRADAPNTFSLHGVTVRAKIGGEAT